MTNRIDEMIRDFVGIADIAVVLGCSTRTVHRYIELGKLPKPIRVGRFLKWPRDEFSQWLNSSR